MLADEAADAGHAGVVLDLEERAVGLVELLQVGQAFVGIGVHRAELVHVESLHLAVSADPAHALLGVDGTPRALQADRQAQQERGRQQHGYHAEREHYVERPLRKAVCEPCIVAHMPNTCFSIFRPGRRLAQRSVCVESQLAYLVRFLHEAATVAVSTPPRRKVQVPHAVFLTTSRPTLAGTVRPKRVTSR